MPSIAIIGASPDRRKFGNKAVRAYAARGYSVYPIHPKEKEIEGWPAYPSIRALPVESLDRVTIYLPPALGLSVLPELVGRSIGEVLLNPGADAPEVIAKGKELGLNIITGCSIVMIGENPDNLSDE